MHEFNRYQRLTARISSLPGTFVPSEKYRAGHFLRVSQIVNKDAQQAARENVKDGE